MTKEDKIKSLLLYILEALSEATTSTNTDEENLTSIEFRYTPEIIFDSDQMELIRELNNNELEDLTPITGE